MSEEPKQVSLSPQLQARVRAAESAGAQGDLVRAIALYGQLLEELPGWAEGWYNVGLLQRLGGDFVNALLSYEQALRLGIAAPEEVHLNRAVILSDFMRRDDLARAELEAALKANPGYLPAKQNLANLAEDLGERERAAALYEELLGAAPRAYQVLARAAQLARGTEAAAAQITRLRAALTDPDLSAYDRASLLFALAHLLDGAGAYAEAFATAREANAASRASLKPPARYDRAAQERLIDELIAAFPAPVPVERPPAQPEPIFICGMFRSGSTLAERVIGGHDRVRAGGELELLPALVRAALTPFPRAVNQAGEARLASLALQYLGHLAQRFPGAAYVTDKRPDNFLYIGLIKRLFPRARIVHTVRNPLDTCLSLYFLHLDPQYSYALDLEDSAHYYRQYRRLMAHWRALYGADILDFDYDAFVREPRPQAERLLSFLGLEWQESCLDFAGRGGSVKTASAWQVRQGLYTASSGRSRHYAHELAAVAALLPPA